MRVRLPAFLHSLLFPQTLRKRSMGLIGNVFLLTLVATGVSVYIFTYRTEVDTWRDRQAEAARAAAATVGNFLDKAQSLLAVGFLLDKEPVDDQQIADKLIEYNPAFYEVVRLDAQGSIDAAASRDQPILSNLFTISQSQWYREARAGRAFYGSVQISAQNAPYLILAVPLADGGIAAGRLRMDILQDVVSNVHFGYSGKAYVFNSEGQVIAHTNHQLVLDFVDIAGRPEYNAVTQAADRQWVGSFINLQGDPVVGVYAKVPGTDWYVLTEILQSEAFENSHNIWWVLGGILLFMTLAIIALGKFSTSLIFAPISELKKGAVAIGEGNFNYRIGMQRSDEIGILAGAFDDMAAQVGDQRQALEQRAAELEVIAVENARLYDQTQQELVERREIEAALQSINVELEQRVLARTAELSQMNVQLIQENEEKSQLYAQIQVSLKEKEILLKEIHHRVKNNLQVISSLLSLQSSQIQDLSTRQLFRDSQNRVRSMALIHEKLYQSSDLASIDFGSYIQSLSSFLVRSFATEAQGVAMRVEVENIALSIDQAIPCGLIINELVSNSLKYAFPDERKGEVYIQFKTGSDLKLHLIVGDNGIGFPDNIDFQNTTSLGLQLVNSLVSQVDGTVELIRGIGTEYRIVFCEPEKESF